MTVVLLLLALSFLGLSPDRRAQAFPFQAVAPGQPVPSVRLSEAENGSALSLADLTGSPILAIFWGADIPEKKERVVGLLQDFEQSRDFFAKRRVKLLSIDIQNDSPTIIDEVRQRSGSIGPVYLDPDRQSFDTLGVYVIPSVLLIDRSGTIVAGFGYSRDLVSRVRGEVAIMLGEKSREQVERELRPAVTERTEAEKRGQRYFLMAANQASRGRTAAAIRSYEQALEADPGCIAAAVELGCLALEAGQLDKARKSLERIGPADSPRAKICLAQLKSAQGDPAGALEDLKRLAEKKGEGPGLLYAQGRIQQDLGLFGDAAASYRRAFELLQSAVPGDSGSAEPAAGAVGR